MSKYLVIVESPTKEKTISRFLGPEYTVKSSFGHIRDLPKSEMGVDVEHGFKPKYVTVAKGKKLVPELRKLSEKSELVYLATDYDREGEAIAWHLREALKLKDDKARRVTFHEITPEAIRDAVKHPRGIDDALVDSQQARRILDRLVGYELSPLLWKKIRYGLSAGRVQSVAVRLICDREEEIEGFKPQEYWTVDAELAKLSDGEASFTASLVSRAGKKFEKFDVRDKETADAIVADLSGASYVVRSIEKKERRRSPFPPYMTSTLQQDASRRLGFSSSRTMKLAQRLYEGVAVGSEGTVGLITYMRTDSLNIAEVARREAKQFIAGRYGERHLPPKPRVYKSKAKGAQEAHEAIRPSSVRRTPEEMRPYLSVEEHKLYDLIWRRFVASQMADAVYDTVAADIAAGEYGFRATGRTLKFSGFLEVYLVSDEEDRESALPELSVEEALRLVRLVPEQHFTEPPPRFNEASLIRALEEHGVGRPSTYAPTINTIIERSYVRLDQKRFHPTDLGRLVNDVLKKHFANIVDVAFTAGIEEKLDLVAEGQADWTRVLGDFYGPFHEDLEKAEKNLGRQKVAPQKTEEVCPTCGRQMVIRESRRGRFLACSGFPECRTTFSVDKQGNKIVKPKAEPTDEVCEKCGKPMVRRVGRRGPFLACSGFPKCRNTRNLPAEQKPEGREEAEEPSGEKKEPARSGS